jgi:hypothetical protein
LGDVWEVAYKVESNACGGGDHGAIFVSRTVERWDHER